MIKRIEKYINTEEKKRLLSNFFSLSVLQGANYILPLITLPYLVRVLGVEKFGLLAFASATIAYFGIITDYGFNLTATREISIHRNDKEKVVEIFSSVMSIKFMLMGVSFLFLTLLVFSFEKFSKDWLIYYLTFGTVVGQTLFPVWFFQGMERMKYITYLNILSKTIFTIAIFIFVQKQSDYYIVPILTSIGFIVAGVISLILIKKEFQVGFRWQSLQTLKYHLKNGWHVFLSQINISLFSSTNIIILGLLTNNTAVGYYSSAEKIMRAIAMMQSPITGAIFPYMAKQIKLNKNIAMINLKRIIKIGGTIYIGISILVIIFAQNIIDILYGTGLDKSVLILQIIAVAPLTIFLNNIFGTQIMLNTNREKKFSKILFNGAIINIFFCFILSYYFSYIGTAISLLIVELYIMLLMYFSIKKDF